MLSCTLSCSFKSLLVVPQRQRLATPCENNLHRSPSSSLGQEAIQPHTARKKPSIENRTGATPRTNQREFLHVRDLCHFLRLGCRGLKRCFLKSWKESRLRGAERRRQSFKSSLCDLTWTPSRTYCKMNGNTCSGHHEVTWHDFDRTSKLRFGCPSSDAAELPTTR